jgi:DNA gyrase subunit A
MTSNPAIEQKIVDTLEQNYMPYAMSVIISRAIPEIDGFKPSHRKLLYTMYKMGLLGGARTKSANVVGQTMKLNPHGDMAIYETLVRLARGNAALLHPFIDSKGNFGKQYSRDMRFAAPRYTEVRLDAICEAIFRDLDQDAVDFTDNYDSTMKEPRLLPTLFPNILANSNQGIAVGMASNFCSFNLREVCAATVALLQDETADFAKHLLAPDLSSGGQLIYEEREMEAIYRTGRGSFKLRARYRYDRQNNCVEIIEIPYTTTAEAIIDAIIELVKSGRIKDIADVRDETDLEGLKITLDIRKSADPDALMNKLFKLTPLEESFNCNFNLLVNGRPQVLGIRQILQEWILFRIDCLKRTTIFAIAKNTEKLHLLEGLARILLDIDKAIRIVRETERETEVLPNLMAGFSIDQLQAEFVAEIKLRNLNREYILNRTSETGRLKEELAGLKELLESEAKLKQVISGELQEIARKYGQERRSEIIHAAHVETITQEHLIEDYNLKLFLTEQGYLKKIPLTSLRSAPEQRLKEEDRVAQEIESHNKADLLFFSNKQAVYKMKVYEVDDCKASDLGAYLSNLLELDPEERIIHLAVTDDYLGWLFFAFENGKFAKIDLAAYATKTNRRKLANAYSGLAPLLRIFQLTEDIDLAAFSSIQKVLIFSTATVNAKTTRNSQGVQVLKGKKGSRMTAVKTLTELEFTDHDYYRTKNIPAIGCYLRPEDRGKGQGGLELELE